MKLGNAELPTISWSLEAFTVPLITKKCAAGESGVFGVVGVGVGAGVFLVVVVLFDPAADAEPATNTARVAPSANIKNVVAVAAAALRRGLRLLTTYLPCRSPAPPGSRALPGAGR